MSTAGQWSIQMSMDERMTLCNMSIEGGARVGYVNPIRQRSTTSKGGHSRRRVRHSRRRLVGGRQWPPILDAMYDDEVVIDGSLIEPRVTWGINPGQSVGVGERVPELAALPSNDSAGVTEALEFMGFDPGAPIRGTRIDVAFVGSCTNLAAVGPS